MPAAATDYYQKVGRSTATTLSAPGYTIGNTSINVGSTTNWPTTTGITFAIDTIDSNGVRVAGTYNTFRGTVNTATQITNVTYVGGDANQNYSAGSTTRVYILAQSDWANRLVDGILVHADQDGTLKAGAVDVTAVVADSILTKAKLDSSMNTELNTGWVSSVLPAVSSVTANGNRSYDITFASTVASILSSGMRLRTTRTVAAPTTCFSLDGTNDYYNDTSVAGMTFTDDFTVGAWIKLNSYASSTIISRLNGTSGWCLELLSSGIVRLTGYNGGGGNYSLVSSYQSVPLNKWVFIAAQLDMSAFTATTTTSYITFDGKDVPASVSRGGTNPTALVQAGNLELGSQNAGAFFPGKIGDAFVASAKITQANIATIYSKGLTASDVSTHSMVSAYTNGSTTDLNTTNANNLTAQNGATTATSAPYGNDGVSSTLDYALVMAVSGSTATVQVPEGCTIPTSGGVTSVAYSVQGNPYGYRDPGNVIGYAEIRATATATTQADVGGLTSTVYVPSGRSVRIVFDCFHMADNIGSGLGNYTLFIMEGATQLASTTMTSIGSGFTRGVHREVEFTPTAGSHTYKIQMSSATGTVTLTAAATSPAFMSVQLIPQA